MRMLLSIVFGFVAVVMLSSCLMFRPANTVVIVTQPEAKPEAPAKIYIDGDFVGNHYAGMDAPVYKVSCRKHKFKILAEGYAVWEKEVIILNGDPHRLVALLRKKQ